MKRLLALTVYFSGLLLSHKSKAQASPSRFSIVISPAVFVPVTVAAQVGIQYKAGNNLFVLAEAAHPTFYPSNTEYEKIKYFRTGIEFKFVTKEDSVSTKYFSLQANYLFRELQDSGQGFYYTKTQTFAYENSLAKSPVLSLAIKTGFELYGGKRFFFDVFAGLGARFIFTEYISKAALVTSVPPPKQDIFKFDDAWKYNYTLIRPHATAGVRLGVRL